MDQNNLLESVVLLACKAGDAILAMYQQQMSLDIKTKLDNSPVTLADLRAHEIIVAGLSHLTPNIPILSEEDPNIAYETRSTWQQFWLVDPLDGTQEFIHRSGQFTVNIALIEAGKPILGVIFVPLKGLIYYGAIGLGCYKKEVGKLPHTLQVRQWQKGNELILVTTRKELHEELQHHLNVLAPVEVTYRSSSLKFCLLAEGLGDIYLRKKKIHEWDTAAGQCILEAAGGIVLDSNWTPLRYNTKSHLLNPPFIAVGDSTHLLPILKLMPIFEENSND